MKEQQLELRLAIVKGNLSQLDLLLEDYFYDAGRYPPMKYQRVPGEPYHSWRILLLPYMGGEWEDRYHKYDFSKNWNDPENIKAMGGEIPYFYKIWEPDDQFTDYIFLEIDGESESKSKSFSSCFLVVPEARLILIEDEGSAIHWMSPEN